MRFERCPLHASQLLERRGGIRVEDKDIGGRILLSASCVCCCTPNL